MSAIPWLLKVLRRLIFLARLPIRRLLDLWSILLRQTRRWRSRSLDGQKPRTTSFGHPTSNSCTPLDDSVITACRQGSESEPSGHTLGSRIQIISPSCDPGSLQLQPKASVSSYDLGLLPMEQFELESCPVPEPQLPRQTSPISPASSTATRVAFDLGPRVESPKPIDDVLFPGKMPASPQSLQDAYPDIFPIPPEQIQRYQRDIFM